jgi:hypothetical protein
MNPAGDSADSAAVSGLDIMNRRTPFGRVNVVKPNRADLTGLDTMFQNAVTFIAAPKAMKSKLEAPGTLNLRGVEEALRRELGKNVIPELRRIHRIVTERKEAMKQERAALAKPKIDATDAAAISLRWESRDFLRGLDAGERMKVLMDNPDPTMLAAALEGPPALSGLTAETRAHVEGAYVQANHSQALKAIEDREEAVAVVGAAAEMALMEVRSHVGIKETLRRYEVSRRRCRTASPAMSPPPLRSFFKPLPCPCLRRRGRPATPP